eukprot:6204312-Pleurochrysis_carterae.AAC.4
MAPGGICPCPPGLQRFGNTFGVGNDTQQITQVQRSLLSTAETAKFTIVIDTQLVALPCAEERHNPTSMIKRNGARFLGLYGIDRLYMLIAAVACWQLRTLLNIRET